MADYTDPDFARSALVTIDTQKDFTLPDAPLCIPGTLEIIPNMVRLLEAYRHAGKPIVHIVRLYLPDGSNVDLCRRKWIEEGTQAGCPDTEGAELMDELKPSPDVRLDAEKLLAGEVQSVGPNEVIIYKSRWGAFFRTPLEAHLCDLDVHTLVFCGCNYPNCPRTSIYEASERDFRIVLANDAISGVYDRGRTELANIGVCLMPTVDITEALGAS